MEEALIDYVAKYLRDQRDIAPSDAPIKNVLTIMNELPLVFQDNGWSYLSLEVERSQYAKEKTYTGNNLLFSIYFHQFTKSWYPTAQWNSRSVFVKKNAKQLLTGRSCMGDEWSIVNILKKLTSQSSCTNGNVIDPINPTCYLAHSMYVDSIDWDVPSASIDWLKYVSRINCVASIWDIKYVWL